MNLRWGLRFCISNELPGNAEDASLGMTDSHSVVPAFKPASNSNPVSAK